MSSRSHAAVTQPPKERLRIGHGDLRERLVQIEKIAAGAVMTGRVEGHSLGLDSLTFFAASVTVTDIRMSDGGSLEKVRMTPEQAGRVYKRE